MYIPEIPNNSLTDEIKEIVRLSQQLEDDYDFEYDPPITEEELTSWENKHKIIIPESVKDWLRFSGYSNICSELVIIKGVNSFEVECELISSDLVIIGEVIGDGEFLCFSKKTGEIIRENHGEITNFKSLKNFLKNTVIRMMKKS